jgi:hypothetical protein
MHFSIFVSFTILKLPLMFCMFISTICYFQNFTPCYQMMQFRILQWSIAFSKKSWFQHQGKQHTLEVGVQFTLINNLFFFHEINKTWHQNLVLYWTMGQKPKYGMRSYNINERSVKLEFSSKLNMNWVSC